MWLLRIMIGLILVVSGFEKVFSPYQNFGYLLEAYQFFPLWLEKPVAMVFPWMEFLTGIFLTLGLWIPQAICSAMVLFAGFVVVVGQALLRGLPLEHCGCFGEMVHIAPRHIIIMDSIVILLLFACTRCFKSVQQFSLDKVTRT